MLCLPAIPADYSGKAEVICGTVLGVKAVVAAGRSFFETYEKQAAVTESASSEGQSVDEEDLTSGTPHKKDPLRKKKKEQLGGNALRLSQLVRDVNLYKVLGVSESCSADDLKKSYRRLVLEKHPDKLTNIEEESDKEACRTEFLQIQEAYDTLSNDRTRRMYDSSLPFDDTIPSEKDITATQSFYDVFGAAFARNERWSVRRPVPSIGDDNSSREYVQAFYDFWYNSFESWRDFSHHDEHDLSQADSRDERRWMEVQNARIRKKRLAEENSRVRRLIDTGEKLDPRLRRWRQAEIDAVANEKRAKQMEKEKKAKEEEDARMRVILEKEMSIERQKSERVEIKSIRSETRQVLRVREIVPDVLEQEKFNDGLLALLGTDIDAARNMLQRATSAASSGTESELIYSVINKTAEKFVDMPTPAVAAPTVAAPAAAPAAAAAPETLAPTSSLVVPMDWTAEELQMLTRGMQKYPVGTNRRWEVIQGLIGGSKTVAQIIDMSKKVATHKVIETPAIVLSKKKAECAAAPDFDYERANRDEEKDKAAVAGGAADEWTLEQQKMLETSMRTFPASMPPAERWTKIAETIPGKSKQQCVARFKYIRELIVKEK